jgi:hypothetical protein
MTDLKCLEKNGANILNFVYHIKSRLDHQRKRLKKEYQLSHCYDHRKGTFHKPGINNVSELLMYTMKNKPIDTIDYGI